MSSTTVPLAIEVWTAGLSSSSPPSCFLGGHRWISVSQKCKMRFIRARTSAENIRVYLLCQWFPLILTTALTSYSLLFPSDIRTPYECSLHFHSTLLKLRYKYTNFKRKFGKAIIFSSCGARWRWFNSYRSRLLNWLLLFHVINLIKMVLVDRFLVSDILDILLTNFLS